MTTTPAQGSRKIYLPVKADTNGIIRDSIGQIVCDTIPEYARQIVTALNSHQQLRKVLKVTTRNLIAAVSAYEAKALKRDALGRTRLADFNNAINVGRVALKASEVKE